jgi:hypothetical protein
MTKTPDSIIFKVMEVIAKMEIAWREKNFDGLEDCFEKQVVITGPNFEVFAHGRVGCGESYSQFSNNTGVHRYSDGYHLLRIWNNIAVYTFSWEMEYLQKGKKFHEHGLDQLVLVRSEDKWEVVFGDIIFKPFPCVD